MSLTQEEKERVIECLEFNLSDLKEEWGDIKLGW